MLNTPVQAATEGMPASKTITRRAALCGIATLPALGGATAALAEISASAHPDAELLALRTEYDAARKQFEAKWWEWQAIEEAFETANPAPGGEYALMAWHARRFKYLEDNDHGEKARDALLDQMDEIAKRVRAIQPKTVAGLAVWSNCLVHDCMNPGDFAAPLNEVGWDQEHIRRLAALIDQMAGAYRGGEVTA